MKKKFTALLLASMVTFAGCSTEDTSSQNAEETTTAATTATESPYDCVLIDYSQEFNTYESFAAEFKEMHPTSYLYELSEASQDWLLEKIDYDRYFYIFYFRDAANETDIRLEINFSTAYDTIERYDIPNYCEILEGDDRYVITHRPYATSGEFYDCVGITGNLNIFYQLNVTPDDDSADEAVLLREYKELLAL